MKLNYIIVKTRSNYFKNEVNEKTYKPKLQKLLKFAETQRFQELWMK